ncbi:MAG: hypothetical protein JW940_26430 [Polyangiaceae bacterium]|nr:hypothetical protein [Polyangiaceae bacterium]
MRRSLLQWVALLLASACSGAGGPRAAAPPPKPLRGGPVPKAPARSEYVVSDQALGYGRLHFGGQGRVLVDGIRVADDEPPSTQNPTHALVGGRALPSRLGGGFLFWNREELYWASRFTGPLRPVGALPGYREIATVSFGDDFALVHFTGGGRAAWSPARPGFIEMPEIGLVDVAVGEDGRALKLREPNQLLLRAAGSRTYSCWNDPGMDVKRIEQLGGRIIVDTGSHGRLVLNADASLSPPPLDRTHLPDGQMLPRDPRYRLTVTPRAKAFQAGVLTDADHAVIEVNGAFAVVDLRSGFLIEMTNPLRPAMGPCELLPMLDDVLAICHAEESSLIIAGLRRLQPSIEMRFDGRSTFYAGAPGTLMKDGPCNRPADLPDHLSVCLREPSGKWKTVGPRPRGVEAADEIVADGEKQGPTTTQEPALTVSRWIPTHNADAVGVVLGDRPGLFHARSGKFLQFTDKTDKSQWDRLKSAAALVHGDFEVARNGHLVGITAYGVVDVAPDGQVLRTQHMAIAGKSGPYLLARDAHGQAWQSSDHGFTWELMSMPPGSSRLAVTSCSYAGCVVNGWYRIGYPSVVPKQWLAIEPPHSPLPTPQTAARLVCQTEGKVKHGTLAIRLGAEDGHEPNAERFSFTSPFSDDPPTLLADTLMDFPYDDPASPLFRRAVLRPRRLQFHVPFTRAKLDETGIVWGDVMTALLRRGSDETPFDNGLDGFALPVLSSDGQRADGLLLLAPSDTPQFAIWVRTNRPPRVFALSQVRTLTNLYSVVARPDGRLAAAGLVDEQSEVFLLSPESSVLLGAPLPGNSRPPRPDVVAVKEDGSLGLLRIWSTGAPSHDDPALVLPAQGPPVVLAPWSSLVAGPCEDGPGYRAIVNVEDWVGLEVGRRSYTVVSDSLALVHWNPARVCMSAIEIPHAIPLNEEVGAVEILAQARFDKQPSAVRYGFGLGEEYVEELQCRLVSE